MKELIVTAKNGKGEDAASTSVTLQFPENLSEAVDLYGEEAILTNAKASWVITLQSAIRRMKAAGKSDEDIQKACAEAKMGVAMERVSDPVASMKAKFANMNDDEKAAFLAELQKIAGK